MFLRKYWIGLSVLLVAICALGLFLLRDETPQEPIKIYKVTTPAEPPAKVTAAEVKQPSTDDTTGGGHFHAEPHFEADTDDDDRSDEVHQQRMDALSAEKSELIQEKEAYIQELEAHIASSKEMGEIRAWFDTNLDPLITELRPFFAELSTGDLAAAETFFQSHYPTTEARVDAARKLLKLTDLCREFLSRIDASSERSRSRFYEELASGNGWLFGLQDPAYMATVKQYIAYYGGEE